MVPLLELERGRDWLGRLARHIFDYHVAFIWSAPLRQCEKAGQIRTAHIAPSFHERRIVNGQMRRWPSGDWFVKYRYGRAYLAGFRNDPSKIHDSFAERHPLYCNS